MLNGRIFNEFSNLKRFDSNSWAVTLAVIQQMVGILIVISTRPIKEGVPFQYSQVSRSDL